jgi:hypothetical protein
MIRFVLQGTDLFETLQRGHSALHDCGHDQVGLEEGQFLESRDGGRDGFHILHKSADETGTSHPAHFVEHGSQGSSSDFQRSTKLPARWDKNAVRKADQCPELLGWKN